MPWIGYFDMADRVDIFVMLDDVQYIKSEWMNRNKIISNTVDGWQWINVPIQQKSQRQTIAEVSPMPDLIWKRKLCNKIQHNYSKTPYYDRYQPNIYNILHSPYENLADLNVALITNFLKELGLKNNLIRSSSLRISGKREQKLLNICKHLNAKAYLANNGSKSYLAEQIFQEEGIEFAYQDYIHPIYTNHRGEPQLKFLSILDLLFCQGPNSLDIIKKTQ